MCRYRQLDKNKTLKLLGNNIKSIRKKKNISQSELARLCLKDKQSIERVENGKTNPTVKYLIEIANSLDVSLKQIFDFDKIE